MPNSDVSESEASRWGRDVSFTGLSLMSLGQSDQADVKNFSRADLAHDFGHCTVLNRTVGLDIDLLVLSLLKNRRELLAQIWQLHFGFAGQDMVICFDDDNKR